MFCENCGHKLNDNDLFCENCGTKTNVVATGVSKKSNKTLWIVLGSIFGGFFLFVLILIIIFGVLTFSINQDDGHDYEINDYIDDYQDISSYDSF